MRNLSNVTGRRIMIAALLAIFMLGSAASRPALAQIGRSPEEPFVVEYYYKVKWGYADEFIRLFKKNHYPLLVRQIEMKNALSVTAETPIHHSVEEGRWDYRIRIVWKNVQIAHDDSGDEAILKKLFPDQKTFEREEQRRFEILIGHWDVPVKTVPLNEK